MSDIIIKDEIARRNLELARIARKNDGKGLGGLPFLDLDVKAYQDYREGKLSKPPGQDDNPDTILMKRDLDGKNVLCLAGGGGQHSAIFSLLGAKVTVFDLTPEQLELDQTTAKYYGYEVTTIQGDMRDLSALPTHHFDRVYQPISTLYVPNLSEVYRGVARVLKPGGLYYSNYTYPVLYMSDQQKWDGEAYVVRLSQPNLSGRILEKDGFMNFQSGEFFGEFNHLLSDMINGQIVEGLCIVGVWEDPRPAEFENSELIPESPEHRDSILPYGISVISKLPD